MALKVIDILPDGFVFTGTSNGAVFQNAQFYAEQFVMNVTAVSGTNPTLTPKLEVQDPASGSFSDVPGGTLITRTATGITLFDIGPGLKNLVGRSKNGFLPPRFRFVYTVGGSAGPTFTVNFKMMGIG